MKLVDARSAFFTENLHGMEPNDADPEEVQRYAELQGNEQAFGARLNADPELMDIMAVWNVAIRSEQSIPEEFIESLAGREDRNAAIQEAILRQGGMAHSVVSALKTAGYDIHGNELATRGWRISSRCTEASSRRLCAILHRKFHKAIKSEVIFIERWFAEFTLLGPRP